MRFTPGTRDMALIVVRRSRILCSKGGRGKGGAGEIHTSGRVIAAITVCVHMHCGSLHCIAVALGEERSLRSVAGPGGSCTTSRLYEDSVSRCDAISARNCAGARVSLEFFRSRPFNDVRGRSRLAVHDVGGPDGGQHVCDEGGAAPSEMEDEATGQLPVQGRFSACTNFLL